jgi:NAD(P)-dependent dehydrogenase (short-subunit alcohol dehydrogenase family)
MTRIEGQVVLITGASSGIGKALAEDLRSVGAKVYGTSRKAADSEPGMLQLDVRSEESVVKAVKRVMDKEGRIDVLINNAGYCLAGAVEDVSHAEAYEQLDTNFFGVLRMFRAVLPIMRAQRSGLVLNISSVAGRVTLPYQSMYSASKYALEAVTEALRLEAKAFGIRVSMIEPGDTKTKCTANRLTAAATAGSVYEKRTLKAVETMARSEQGAAEPRAILRIARRILASKNPPVRVAVGFEYKLVVLMFRLLPAKLVGFVLDKIY